MFLDKYRMSYQEFALAKTDRLPSANELFEQYLEWALVDYTQDDEPRYADWGFKSTLDRATMAKLEALFLRTIIPPHHLNGLTIFYPEKVKFYFALPRRRVQPEFKKFRKFSKGILKFPYVTSLANSGSRITGWTINDRLYEADKVWLRRVLKKHVCPKQGKLQLSNLLNHVLSPQTDPVKLFHKYLNSATICQLDGVRVISQYTVREGLPDDVALILKCGLDTVLQRRLRGRPKSILAPYRVTDGMTFDQVIRSNVSIIFKFKKLQNGGFGLLDKNHFE